MKTFLGNEQDEQNNLTKANNERIINQGRYSFFAYPDHPWSDLTKSGSKFVN